MMPTFPKRYADAVAKLRVPSGFVLVLVFAWFSRPTSHSLALGLPGGNALGPAVASIVLVAALLVVAALAFRRQEL